MVGQYGEIFSSRDYVLSLPPVGPILTSLELNISPYCPPTHAIIYIRIVVLFIFIIINVYLFTIIVICLLLLFTIIVYYYCL